MDTEADGRWMTYEELAEVRGIDRHSARRLASRLKWARQRDNQQIVRVYVPISRAEPDRRHRDMPADNPQDISRVIGLLGASVSSLTDRAAAAEKRADQAENRAEQAETRAARAERAVADERNRADRAESSRDAERSRADELRGRVDDLGTKLAGAQAELATAQDQNEALRRAEAERRARGVLARLKAAWRGE
jgi:chromosome segregation ATPase